MQLEEEVICHIRCEQGAAVNFWHLAPVNVFYRSACTETHACPYSDAHARCKNTKARTNTLFTVLCFVQRVLELSLEQSCSIEVNPGIKGQGRRWIIHDGREVTFISHSSPCREWPFDSSPQQSYSATRPSPFVLYATNSICLFGIGNSQPYFWVFLPTVFTVGKPAACIC